MLSSSEERNSRSESNVTARPISRNSDNSLSISILDASKLSQSEISIERSEISKNVPDIINSDLSMDAHSPLEFSVVSQHLLQPCFKCIICLQEFSPDDIIKLSSCPDTLCTSCLEAYIRIRIEESQVLSMPCPNHQCRVEIENEIIKKFTSASTYSKYLIFKNNEELGKDPWLRWCPKPDCKGYDTGKHDKIKMTCNDCGFFYCFYCSEEWHGSKKCKAAADIELSKWTKRNNVKYCPNCRRRVEKDSGCDHMTCVKCQYEWCWLCGEKYTSTHYSICEVRVLNMKNPPLRKILVLFFAPAMLPFLCIILCFAVAKNFTQNQYRFSKLKTFLTTSRLRVPFLLTVGILLSPFFFALAPFIGTIAICFKLFRKCRRYKCCFLSCGLINGIIFAPLLAAGFILMLFVMHIIGICGLIWKFLIILRRCKDPQYLRLKSNYRYL